MPGLPSQLRALLLLVAAAVAFPDEVALAAFAGGTGCPAHGDARPEQGQARLRRGTSTKFKADQEGCPPAIQACPTDDSDDPDDEHHRILTTIPILPEPPADRRGELGESPCPAALPGRAIGIAMLCRFRC